MWLFDVFAWLYNLSPFTGALLMWFAVLVATASLTMRFESNRGKLWGFVVSASGAVIILLYLESLNLDDDGKALKAVLGNLVVMTLGGLGSGLLAGVISQGPDEAEDTQARTFIRERLLNIFEYAFFFIGACAFVLFVTSLLPALLQRPVATEHEIVSLLVVFLGAGLGYAIAAGPRRLKNWEQLGAGMLGVLLLFLLPVYVQGLLGLWTGARTAVLSFHAVAALALAWTVWRQRINARDAR
ncbi:hypothetical protein [Pseudomonas mucidolens]|uniref:hypothetical protein n=1 Tax=Pseudomonas mucidolens TaxID=46679 RepID=UPI0030D9F797